MNRLLTIVTGCSVAVIAPIALAQEPCLEWEPGFDHFLNGVSSTDHSSNTIGNVGALALYDEGSGPRLFVGGYFDRVGTMAAANVARWDGSTWSDIGIGTGLSQEIYPKAFAVHDDGSGPALYACGYFDPNDVVRWNGTSWSPVGNHIPAIPVALIEFDDGTGPALYVAAYSWHMDGQPFGRVYVWDGVAWSQVGGDFYGDVRGFAVHDDGTGPALYVGGAFNDAGGTPARGVAKWDGAAWSPLGSGVSMGPIGGEVDALAEFDDGTGPALYVGGRFGAAGGNPASNVARWHSGSWSALGAGVAGTVYTVRSLDLGVGPKLYVGGNLSAAGGAPSGDVVVWDGGSWSSLGVDGVANGPSAGGSASVESLEVDPNDGSALYAAGYFQYIDGREVNAIARWDGNAWSPLGPTGNGMNGSVLALASASLGSGYSLYAGGSFATAGGMHAEGLARWEGTSWAPVGEDLEGEVKSLAEFDDGGGPRLYVGGDVYLSGFGGGGIFTWDGTSFALVGGGTNNAVRAMVAYDDGGGPDLYAGGEFNTAGSAGFVNAIARWDGSSWSSLGPGMNGIVNALAVFPGGVKSTLFVGGSFTTAGGLPASYMARWDGTSWSAMPGAPNNAVITILLWEDVDVPALYVGGAFTQVGATPASHIAMWNGVSWSALGSGCNGLVDTLGVFDDGSGPALYAGGDFTTAGGISASHLAKWNGSSWSSVDAGTDGRVHALASFDDGIGNGPDLWVGGDFANAGGIPSSHVAQWHGCSGPGIRMCFGDGSLATHCPCANYGVGGHGCANSSVPPGAILGSSGTTNPDTVVLSASDERPTALTIFLQGTETLTAGVVFGDGLRCASGILKRLYVKNASGGAVSAPGMGDLSITARSAALGNPIAPGTRRYYQTYYRDANSSFCPAPAGNTFNSSNAIKIVW